MLPRPLSHPHHLLVRLPSDGELARTRTAAPERSQSRLTSHGARDDTRHRSSDISRLRARTHALPSAPSCTGLSSGSDLTLRSGSPPTPPTYARSQPNLPTARLQQPRAARRGRAANNCIISQYLTASATCRYFHTSVGQQLSRSHRKSQRSWTWCGAPSSNPLSSAMRT